MVCAMLAMWTNNNDNAVLALRVKVLGYIDAGELRLRLSELIGLLSFDALLLLIVVDTSWISTRSDVQVFTKIIDTIVSPNYPAEYGNNEFRKYVIRAPTKREIVLIFNSFDVEYESDCDYDSLLASIFLI